MEDCSIVRVQQLRCKCSVAEGAVCPRHNSQRMFGSLWNVVVAHEHRRQDVRRRLGTMARCHTATDERATQPWSRRAGVPVANKGFEVMRPFDTTVCDMIQRI